MKTIVMFVWNDFDYDDRVSKKALSLSKHFDVYVISICKKPKEHSDVRINDNLYVRYIWFDKFYKWLYYRLLANKSFWKKTLSLTDIPIRYKTVDIVDCNDPDTLWVGVLLKQEHDCKIVYDSHEYWKGTFRVETNLSYSLYSLIGNKLQYFRELVLVDEVDKIICVSKSIRNKLNSYKKSTSIIYNYSNYNPESVDKENSVVFFGSKVREGCNGIIKSFMSNGINAVAIGNKIKINGIDNKGYLSKKEYKNILPRYKFGICYFDVTCDNIRYCMPNKLFEYIQAEIPMIVNRGMVDATRFVAKNEIGSICTDNYNDAIMDLVENYEKYLKNIKRIKRRCSWEYQEPKLVNIYKTV